MAVLTASSAGAFRPISAPEIRLMTASISSLPIWKKDSTPAEWLQEIATIAMEHPERFARIVVVCEEENKEGFPYKTRFWSRNHKTNTDIIGSLQVCALEVFEYMKGRRE